MGVPLVIIHEIFSAFEKKQPAIGDTPMTMETSILSGQRFGETWAWRGSRTIEPRHDDATRIPMGPMGR